MRSRNKLILLLLLIFSNKLVGQNIYPEKNLKPLLGKKLKVTPLTEGVRGFGYPNFYKDKKLKKALACCDGYNSKYNSLVNQTFTLTEITPDYDINGNERFILSLQNPEFGTVYYLYSPSISQWVFKLGIGESLSNDFYCKNIKTEIDKFTGDTTYSSKFERIFSFSRIRNKSKDEFYLTINQSYLGGKKEGSVILLLENNNRLEWQNRSFECGVVSGSIRCFNEIKLNQNEVNLLIKNGIVNSRTPLYDLTMENDDTITLKEYLKCVLSIR